MSRPWTGRLAGFSASCRAAAAAPRRRLLSQTSARRDEASKMSTPGPAAPQPRAGSGLKNLFGAPPAAHAPKQSTAMADISQTIVFQALRKSSNVDTSALSLSGTPLTEAAAAAATAKREMELEPHHLHIFSHKHNTHVTVTRPNRDPILSLSCGNIGFRKARRSTFDAAYSLTKYVLERLVHMGVDIGRLEVVLRGFGKGREAAVKVLMSPEGKFLRDKIIRVADATRIKFGGTRSKRRRRL